MLDELAKIKYYLAFLLVLSGVFVWATLTGTRFLGDDKESRENINGYGQGGHSSYRRSGYRSSGFYHK
jgi:hypothetical protein